MEKMPKVIPNHLYDPKWIALKKEIQKRDRGECQLIPVLTAREFLIWRKNPGVLSRGVDPAHVFPKGLYPSLKYELDNVWTINRFSHDCLDNCKDPVTGEDITKEERDNWWKRIIGIETYEKLLALI